MAVRQPTLIKAEPKTGEHIEFPLELNRTLETSLTLTNISSHTVAYKMKVNAPKTYLVRPSGGVLAPKENQVISIYLQPVTERIANNVHRFLINSVIVPDGTTSLGREAWPKLAEGNQVEEQLLNVIFKTPLDGGAKDTAPPGLEAVNPQAVTRANPGDIKEKFDELKGYALSLEREITDLKSKKKNPVNAAAGGYSVLHLLIAVIVSLLVYKLLPRFI